jgi:hypothetical protein
LRARHGRVAVSRRRLGLTHVNARHRRPLQDNIGFIVGIIAMIWIARLLLVAAGSIAALFVARDAANFGVVEVLIAMVLIFLFVVGTGWWIQRWKKI